MKKHFVTFFSPGTFVAEESTKEIDSWDIEKAKQMASEIVERHGATPFGFRFLTRTRKDSDLDSKVTERSPMYYLGGRIETLAEVEARRDPSEKTLVFNMRANKIERVIINTNSWKVTFPFNDGDVLLPFEAPRRSHRDSATTEATRPNEQTSALKDNP